MIVLAKIKKRGCNHMAELNLSKYGIVGTTEIVHNPSYDELFAEGISPIARWGTPEDIAGAVGALCSDDFLYTTGSHIYVDGGLHIKRL